MLEKINLLLKKSIRKKKLEKIAATILYEKSSDHHDKSYGKIAVQRLAIALDAYLKLDYYNRTKNKHNIHSQLFEQLLRVGLVERKMYGHNNWENNDEAPFIWPTDVNSVVITSFPCGLMPPHKAIDAIKFAVLKVLKNHYPALINDKTALTVMCIRHFHPQSFFAKLPKDVVKIILNQAKITGELPTITPKNLHLN